MAGFYFYWLFWLFWVMAAFFMKEKKRFNISVWLLWAIIFSLHHIYVFNLEFSITSVFMLFTVYYLIGQEKGRVKLYLFFTSFIMMLVYTTFLLYELFDPVWVIFNRTFMLVTLLVIVVITIQKTLKFRLVSLLAGLIHGDILYAVILRSFSISYTVGSFHLLDIAAFSMMFLLGITAFLNMSAYFETHIKQLEREKQKQS